MFGAPYRLDYFVKHNLGDGPLLSRCQGTFSGRLPREFHLLLGLLPGQSFLRVPRQQLKFQPDFRPRSRAGLSRQDLGRSAETGCKIGYQ